MTTLRHRLGITFEETGDGLRYRWLYRRSRLDLTPAEHRIYKSVVRAVLRAVGKARVVADAAVKETTP